MEFDLRFLDERSYRYIQRGIDAVNKIANSYDPGAWNYVSDGSLRHVHKGLKEPDIISKTILDEMKLDDHSARSLSWTVTNLTSISRNYLKWRKNYLKNMATIIYDNLDEYVTSNIPVGQKKTPESWELALAALDSNTLVKLLMDEDIPVLQYLTNMDDISHLTNQEVLTLLEGTDFQKGEKNSMDDKPVSVCC
jgi:hypothetical protein